MVKKSILKPFPLVKIWCIWILASKDNVERVLETAEQFPIFLWQLSVAKVMCHPIYIESFQREPPIKIYRASDGGHKKVLSPISRLILWIMEATVTGAKSIEVFHWIWYLDWGQERRQKELLSDSTKKPDSQISVLCLLFGLRISFTDCLLTFEMEEAIKRGENTPQSS